MGLQSIKNRSSGQENADAIFAMVLFENIDKYGGGMYSPMSSFGPYSWVQNNISIL